MTEHDTLAALQAENARLVTLLEANGIEWRLPPDTAPLHKDPATFISRLSTVAKIALFRRLFRRIFPALIELTY